MDALAAVAFLALSLAAPASAAEASPKPPKIVKFVHHLDQFGDTCRAQENVGSCHAFGAVAVLEAAFHRLHKKVLRLSEADLFFRRTVMGGGIFRKFCEKGECGLSEYHDTYGDVQFVLTEGVASSLHYGAFLKRYRAYRRSEVEELKFEKAFADSQIGPGLALTAEAVKEREIKELAESEFGRSILNDPQLAAERSVIRSLLTGFSAKEKRFPYLGRRAPKISPKDCARVGSPQKRLLLEELDAGRPVTVVMSLAGLTEWGADDPEIHADHAFMIIGYTAVEGGSVNFHTRNPWGSADQNHDVWDHQACRIHAIITVLAPGETTTLH